MEGVGVGLPAAPVVRKINTEVNSKGKGLFCLLLSRVDYFQHKPIATTTKAAGIFPHGHALCSEGRQRGVSVCGSLRGISGRAGFR